MSSGSVRLAVRSVGGFEGSSTLVLIHGGPQLSHHYMRALEPLASRDRRVVTYDQRGVGESTEGPADSLTLVVHAGDLDAVRAELSTHTIHLLGHSWGGLIAMSYAIAYPHQTASMILVDSLPPSWGGVRAAHQRFERRAERLVESGQLAESRPPARSGDCMPALLRLLPVYFADPTRPPTAELLATTCHGHVGVPTWENLWGFDLTRDLAGLTVPCLVLQGEADPFGRAMADEIVEALQVAAPRRILLPDCGHFPWIEQADLFFDGVQDFLESLDA